MIGISGILPAALFCCLALAGAPAGPAAAGAAKDSGGRPADGVLQAVEAAAAPPQIAYNPGNRRDPFLNPLPYRKKSGQLDDEEVERGAAPPGIAGTYIAQAVLLGISMRDEGRLAVVRGADSRAYFLREGDRLFDGYVRKIDNGSITLVRETKMKSGKILTQEVTKQLRKP